MARVNKALPGTDVRGNTRTGPVERAIEVMSGKWTAPILFRLRNRAWRQGQPKRARLLMRTVSPVMSPKVEHSVTPVGQSTMASMEQLRAWRGTLRTEANEE